MFNACAKVNLFLKILIFFYILPLTIAGSTEYIVLKRMFQRQLFTVLSNLNGYCKVSDVSIIIIHGLSN